MFRDLKEYQDLAKIYAEKVSKPENLDENRNTLGSELAAKRLADKPKTREEVGLKPKVTSFADRRAARGSSYKAPEIKKFPSTAEIRSKSTTGMSNIPSKEGNAVIDGKKLNPNFGKKVDIKKEFPDKTKTTETKTNTTTETKPLTNREKFNKKFIRDPKTKTLKRRGSPTARRAENLEKNRLKAQAMAKARIEAKKKAGEQGNSTQSNSTQSNSKQSNSSSSQTMTASYTPDMDAYDIVLEYLLSTEQVDTIEEANYVMMQLDEENIQEIVGAIAKTVMKTPLVKLVPAAIGTGIATKMIASKMGKKSVQPVAPPEVKKPSEDIKVGDGIKPQQPGESLLDYYKRRTKSLETQDKKLGSGDY